MTRSRLLRSTVLVALAVALLVPTLARSRPADAFGTVYVPFIGQRVVHEKITRVLACGSTLAPTECFEPMTMDVLAGHKGTFGAVGEPDNPLDGMPNPAARHCDDGDHGYGSPHSKEDAWAAIQACLDHYQRYLQFAVDSAAGLLHPDGTVDRAQTSLVGSRGDAFNACALPDPNKGQTSSDPAKCNVLNGLGRALHLYQDFWSHSNWGDVAAPNKPVGAKNPVGLARTDQPDFFAFPSPVPTSLPEELISGCDDSMPFSTRCGVRTGHSTLNKDNGDTVRSDTCVAAAPLTDRAKVVVDGTSNFQRAITGACGATLRAWSDLRAALRATYGEATATAMVEAIVTDVSATACRLGGVAAKALAPPSAARLDARSVDVVLGNQTGAPLGCDEVVLDGGEWAAYPADSIAPGAEATWRTQGNGTLTGTEGSAAFLVEGSSSPVSVHWSNPAIGEVEHRCDAGPELACTTTATSDDDLSVTITVVVTRT